VRSLPPYFGPCNLNLDDEYRPQQLADGAVVMKVDEAQGPAEEVEEAVKEEALETRL
jgi:hypothetical protein